MRIFILFALIFVGSVIAVTPVGSPILDQEDAIAFWTPERLRSAIPLDAEREFNVHEALENLKKIDPKAIPGYKKAFNPHGPRNDTLNITSIQACSLNGAYAPSYNIYPWITIGKTYFQHNGQLYTCSGASVDNYGIIAAAHCVYRFSTGSWATNFIFVPGYNNGNSPCGAFAKYQFWVHDEWITTGSYCYDYAFITLCRNTTGHTVGQCGGWLGLTWNQPLGGQTWTSLGYPAAPPFGGLKNYYTVSSHCSRDSECTNGIASDTTGGASGGPWVLGWQTTNLVNSINAYVYSPQTTPPQIFGPYFDTSVSTLFNAAFATAPTC